MQNNKDNRKHILRYFYHYGKMAGIRKGFQPFFVLLPVYLSYIRKKNFEVVQKMLRKKTVIIWSVRIIFTVCFCLGIIGANLWFSKTGIETSPFFMYREEQTVSWNDKMLYGYLLVQRLPLLLFLLFFCKSKWKWICFNAVAGWFGFSFGYFMSQYILGYGITGFVNVIRTLFPHFLCYVFSFGILLHIPDKGMYSEENTQGQLWMRLVIIAAWLIGILMEGIMNSFVL